MRGAVAPSADPVSLGAPWSAGVRSGRPEPPPSPSPGSGRPADPRRVESLCCFVFTFGAGVGAVVGALPASAAEVRSRTGLPPAPAAVALTAELCAALAANLL